MDYTKLFNARIDRRRLIGNLGLMGAGAALTACAGVVAQPGNGPDTDEDYDAAILNFALNLEYLEAAFYLAAVGRLSELPGGGADVQLPAGFDGSTAIDFQALSGNAAVGAALAAFASEIANEELAHVNFLRAALTDAGAPVAERPVLNLASSFQTAAAVAFDGVNPGDVGLPATFTPADFNPFANGTFFAHGAYIFEDVGVTAYKGAAPLITSKAYLEAAAGILASEAYHSGTLRTFLYLADTSVLDFYGGLNVHAIAGAISNARDALDGDADLDQGIAGVEIATGGDANIAVTDANGVAYSRTPLQVAKIVYLSADAQVSENSFFPQGIDTAGLDADFEFLLSL